MRKFNRLVFAAFLAGILIAGMWIGGKTTIETSQGTFAIANLYLSMILIGVVLCLTLIYKLFAGVKRLFTKSPLDVVAFSKEIEQILSALLVKDADTADKHINKIRQYINDSPLLYWLEGNIQIIRNNLHKAKSLFYMAAAGEDKTNLGSYSLCRLASQAKDRITEKETLENIIQTSGYQEDLVLRLLIISLMNNDFVSVNKQISLLKEHKAAHRLEGIALYSESRQTALQAYDKLKQAHELSPDISVIAIDYANALIFAQDFKKAKSVIEKTWAYDPHPELFSLYLKLEPELADKIEAGYDLVAKQTNSWIGYFEYGKFLLDNGHLFDAFCNLLAAYGKCRYKCVYDVLYHVCGLLPDPKPESALEILSGKHSDEVIAGEIAWHCSNCGSKQSDWYPVCPHCESVDTISWGIITSNTKNPSVNELLGVE